MSEIAFVISSFQPTPLASELLRIALTSITKFSPANSKCYVFDTGSPRRRFLVHPDEFPTVSFHYSGVTPRSWERTSPRLRLARTLALLGPPRQGSIANGWTLDWALSNPEIQKSTYFMTLQMDVMFTSPSLIPEIMRHFSDGAVAVGVREQLNLGKTDSILHSLGCMWLTKTFLEINTPFAPIFPDFDVGEFAIHVAKNEGNTISSLASKPLDDSSSDAKTVSNLLGDRVDTVYGGDGNELLFLHLGRGIPKTGGKTSKTTALNPWISAYKSFVVDQ